MRNFRCKSTYLVITMQNKEVYMSCPQSNEKLSKFQMQIARQHKGEGGKVENDKTVEKNLQSG